VPSKPPTIQHVLVTKKRNPDWMFFEPMQQQTTLIHSAKIVEERTERNKGIPAQLFCETRDPLIKFLCGVGLFANI